MQWWYIYLARKSKIHALQGVWFFCFHPCESFIKYWYSFACSDRGTRNRPFNVSHAKNRWCYKNDIKCNRSGKTWKDEGMQKSSTIHYTILLSNDLYDGERCESRKHQFPVGGEQKQRDVWGAGNIFFVKSSVYLRLCVIWFVASEFLKWCFRTLKVTL